MKAHCGAAALILILLTGCRMLAPYHPPEMCVQEHWKEGASIPAAVSQAQTGRWWEIFEDPVLSALEERALQNSPSLKVAAWRVTEAWSAARSDRADLYPTLALVPSGVNEVEFTRIFDNDEERHKYRRIRISQYNLPLAAAYEFDLWGRLRYAAESSLASAEAQREAFVAAQLALTASVADVYFALRMLDAESCILQRAIQLRAAAVEVNNVRYSTGLAGYADVSRAETELWLTKAALSERGLLRAQQEHLLAVLLGELPGCFDLPAAPLDSSPPVFAPTLPSELLLNRPDLRQAERELAACYADQGIAYASLFPSLAISTEIGFSSARLAQLLDWKSRFFSFAWEGVQILFDAGQRRADIAAAKARFAQCLNAYSDKVLTAFKEVEDALASLAWQRRSLQEIQQAVEAAQISLTIVTSLYDKGLISYLEVVDAERALLDSQLIAVSTIGAQFASTIELIQASGINMQ